LHRQHKSLQATAASLSSRIPSPPTRSPRLTKPSTATCPLRQNRPKPASTEAWSNTAGARSAHIRRGIRRLYTC